MAIYEKLTHCPIGALPNINFQNSSIDEGLYVIFYSLEFAYDFLLAVKV